MTRQDMITRGFLTEERSPLLSPVTVSGDYRAENGYWYEVTWHHLQPTVHLPGKSAAYCGVERRFARQYGAVNDAESYAAFEHFCEAHLP